MRTDRAPTLQILITTNTVKRYYTRKEKLSNKSKIYTYRQKYITNYFIEMSEINCFNCTVVNIPQKSSSRMLHKSCKMKASCKTGNNNSCLIFTLP